MSILLLNFLYQSLFSFGIHLACIIINKSQAQKHPFQRDVFVLFVTFFSLYNEFVLILVKQK